ncbi:Uncharacterized protein PECH_005996 [Penicillium ucsense]|uniref:Uncharacterized protein n=1 Tax=Penicillium ucsense TaxID=2839758 RepID=A0A8J8WJQ2_9EURO|nr:Uncharacterized protein PECM_006487 [Penicillium ucsense]KAF7735960.1 Uncharacterized protein PECH_005996 [Penicillium ucsense]
MIIGTIIIIEDAGSEFLVTHQRTSVCDIFYFLRVQLGSWFYLRGLFTFLLHVVTKDAILPLLLPMNSETPWAEKIQSAIYASLLAELQIVWLHIVSTKASHKSLHQRMPKFTYWIRVSPVLFVEVLTRWLVFSAAVSFQAELLRVTGIMDIQHDLFMPDGVHLQEPAQLGSKIWIVSIFPKFMEFLVALPIRAVFTRMAVSMLPADDNPIVPLDPRLRNNVPLGILDAWKSFDAASRARFWKVQIRAFVLGVVLFLVGKSMFGDFEEYAPFPIVWFNP